MVWTPTADADAPALADEIEALFHGGTSELYRRTLSDILRVIDVVVRDGAVVATVQPHRPVDVDVIDGMIASGDTLFIHS